jgi:FtsP/CotA-like multicopper oxidase with cupredoxin domain
VFAAVPLVAQQPATASGKTHTYYIAADEVEWDYAPSGLDHMTGKQPEHIAKRYVERGPTRIGKVYRKAIYREYTDETFSQLKPRPAEWEHAGILGPVLRAEVGDTIKVIFRNHATVPYTMHPHGVFYLKDSEGAGYSDGTAGPNKADDAVPPKGTHTYLWKVSERAGPGPKDPSSVVWLYHSHRDEPKDVESGLVGTIIVTRKGMTGPAGRPKDVDREFVTLFMTFDENQSWYLDHNIQTYAEDPKSVNKLDLVPRDLDGAFLFIGEGFAAANFKSTINGFLFGNMPMMEMKVGERVRWYVVSLGAFNMHTPHWHGNVVHFDGKNADVIPILPAEMRVVDMVPDNPGTWMYHCHISDHLLMGMHAHYRVLP